MEECNRSSRRHISLLWVRQSCQIDSIASIQYTRNASTVRVLHPKGGSSSRPIATTVEFKKTHRVPRIDCKRNSADSKSKYVFRHNPHTRCTRRILRPLSRIRAELAGEFSLAIR